MTDVRGYWNCLECRWIDAPPTNVVPPGMVPSAPAGPAGQSPADPASHDDRLTG